ncbi:hypothetical protein LCL95_09975 [Bacillus timonensis]|nr:hypothetical protein [Bacillus timonensis]
MSILLNQINVPSWTAPIIEACKDLGERVYLTKELVYRPFFNERFGPILNQIEIHILVENNSTRIKEELERKYPCYRWNITELSLGIDDYLKNQSFTYLACALKVEDGHLSYVFNDKKCVNDLQFGLIEPTSNVNNLQKEDIYPILSEYPGLSSIFFQVQPLFSQNINTDNEGKDIITNERGGKVCNDFLSEKEQSISQLILEWHQNHRNEKMLVPFPSKGTYPTVNPWESNDKDFREWIIQQTLTNANQIPIDEYLQTVLKIQNSRDQKPTHEGWNIYQHSIMSSLQLISDPFPPNIRACMRIAMLWHDVGKLRNVWTPGAHGAIGAKIWKKPDWMNYTDERLTKFLIKTHDYFGLMDRWIKNSNYKGGLSPKAVREIVLDFGGNPKMTLKLMKHIYMADIGSVSKLRRFLPLTPLLEEIILCDLL